MGPYDPLVSGDGSAGPASPIPPSSEDPAEQTPGDKETGPGHDRRRRYGQDPRDEDLADHAPLDR